MSFAAPQTPGIGTGGPAVWVPADNEYPEAPPPAYEEAVLGQDDVDLGVADGPRDRHRLYPLGEGYFSGISEVDLVRDYKSSQADGVGGGVGHQ